MHTNVKKLNVIIIRFLIGKINQNNSKTIVNKIKLIDTTQIQLVSFQAK